MNAETEHMHTQRVSIIVTKTCTLKCRLCGALAPYVGNYNPTIDFIKREVDAFFRVADRTGIVDISGGEPFLCGGNGKSLLGEILLYLCDSYPDRFDRLRIFTNGTIVPGDALCEAFRVIAAKKPFSVTVDDYGRHSPNVEAVARALRRCGTDFSIRDYSKDVHCDGWVDLRDLSEKHDPKAARELYRKCAIPQKLGCCLELLDGIMTPCSVAAARYLCGEIDRDSDDVIDLFMEPEKARGKLGKILTAEQFDSCRHCNGGLAEDSRRFLPAEQATQSEISEWKSRYAMRI